MEYFHTHLANTIARLRGVADSWLFQEASVPPAVAPSVCGYNSDGSNDDAPLLAFLTSELVDVAFVDPDADGPIGDQLEAALWKDDTMTLQTQNELLCFASRYSAAMLRDTADQRAGG